MISTPLTLPVRITVGEHTTDVGELTLEPGDDIRAALADLFREAADAFDRAEEVTPDGTS
ncbi:hypothetical protein OOK39_21840 [Streptomyces sp. NBC_00264]|uniref:hypothetical protein n=1 Tax=unclassified Streptomyces TaxID=2593676 RepID=UPI0022509EE1|nr:MULTISPECIES: hypothetical protein [unclassified Streptomyces]MCX5161881.1 hypothetical protein [Streptomyces sp. NBC_00305]MCX5161887.1 hypothetical protein [Streptomyces sp. NBC_00305]MCX5220404.1 hypothetical protein [Streptomyces sp. NBC_00264]